MLDLHVIGDKGVWYMSFGEIQESDLTRNPQMGIVSTSYAVVWNIWKSFVHDFHCLKLYKLGKADYKIFSRQFQI